MCGISGYFSRRDEYVNEEALHNSMTSQAYRGPDAQGKWRNNYCGLGHVRLSILDLSTNGSQPMSFSEAKLHISYNGEIYNFKELRKGLIEKGYDFKSDSDTEVLLKGYHSSGVDFFKEVNGMFALAIYDEGKNELILIRDRFGIKPLYYYLDNEKCYFSSELGSLMSFPIPRKIDHGCFENFLQFSYIPDSNSILKGVKQLDPGSFILISSNEVVKEQYYTLNEQKFDVSMDEALREIKNLLATSVNERLLADVPVATFLSSGLDSSIITYLSAKRSPGLKAFSAGFSDYPFFDESTLAEDWGKELQIEHSIIDMKKDELLDSIDKLLNSYSEPFADSSAIAFSLLSSKVSKEEKVVLSGDGADELFGGYRKHKAEYLIRKYPIINKSINAISPILSNGEGGRESRLKNTQRQIKKWLNASSLSNEERYLFWASIASKEKVKGLLKRNMKASFHIENSINSINDILKQDFKQVLTGDMLYKVDRSSMRYGLEVRVPFLDHNLVDYVFALPSDWKLKGGDRKHLLKSAFENEIPRSIRHRKKKGFEVPLSSWLKGPLRPKIDELLNREIINDIAIFDDEYVKKTLNNLNSPNPGNSANIIWSLLVFQQWMINYKPIY